MASLGGYKQTPGSHAQRRLKEDGPSLLVPIHFRFARDADFLTWNFQHDRDALISSLHDIALSYGGTDVNEDPDAFVEGAPILAFLDSAADLLSPDAQAAVALTDFIAALCRLCSQWADFFSTTPQFAGPLVDLLHSDDPSLSLNVLRIHHWIWQSQIQHGIALDTDTIMGAITEIPAPGLDHGIEAVLILVALIRPLSPVDPRFLPIPGHLADLLAHFPYPEILPSVTHAGKKLIRRGGGSTLVKHDAFLRSFLKLLNRAAIGSSDFPFDAFDFVLELMKSVDFEAQLRLFCRVVPATHCAMLTNCDWDATQRYLETVTQMIVDAPHDFAFFDEPFFFGHLRYRVLQSGFLRLAPWLRFCLALILKRGAHVLELLVTNEVILDLSDGAHADDVCDDYLRMIALLFVTDHSTDRAAHSELAPEIADQIRAAIGDPRVHELIAGFAESDDVPGEWAISAEDMAYAREALRDALQ
jgi:hypothetical protein